MRPQVAIAWRVRALAFLGGLAACAAPGPPAAEVSISPPPEPVRSALVDSPATSASASAPSAAAPPNEPRGRGVPAACRGADLVLALVERSGCEVDDEARTPPGDAIELTVGPAVSSLPLPGQPTGSTGPWVATVRSGATVELELSMRNKRTEPLVVDLDVSCGDENAFGTELSDAKGARADVVGQQCGMGMLCGRQTLRVELAPGGRLRRSFTFNATFQRSQASCQLVPGGPLKPGKYTLTMSTPLSDHGKRRTLDMPIAIVR